MSESNHIAKRNGQKQWEWVEAIDERAPVGEAMKEARLGKTLTWCHLASGIKNDLANFSIYAATTHQP